MILDDLHKSNQHSIRPSPGHVLPISAFSLQSEAADYRDDDTCVRDQSPRCPHGLFLWSSVATTSRIHLHKFEICIFSDQLKCTQTTSTFSCIPVGSWELGVGGFPCCTRGFPFPLSKVHNTSCVTKAKAIYDCICSTCSYFTCLYSKSTKKSTRCFYPTFSFKHGTSRPSFPCLFVFIPVVFTPCQKVPGPRH